MAPETLAEIILRAAGSRLSHFQARTRAEILEAAAKAIDAIKQGKEKEE